MHDTFSAVCYKPASVVTNPLCTVHFLAMGVCCQIVVKVMCCLQFLKRCAVTSSCSLCRE